LEKLGEIDKKRKMPVLITTEAIYKIICPNKPISAYQFYSLDESIPIFPSNNKFNRPIIPFYRHQDYSLLIQKWNPYKLRVIEILNSLQ